MSISDKLEICIKWAESDDVPDFFNPDFLYAVQEKEGRGNEITPNQAQAIENIYERFHIAEWAAEEGYL